MVRSLLITENRDYLDMKKLSVFVYREELVIYLRTVGLTSALAHCTVIHSESDN